METRVAFLVLLGTSLLLGVVADYSHSSNDAKVFHVGGKVLCQDCTKSYKEWATDALPIKGCVVGILCRDERYKAIHYGSDATDDEGKFNIVVDRYLHGKEVKPNLCIVRLVSSPHPSCHIATDFANGQTGVKLRRPTTVNRDLVAYMLGPFYYTTPMCEKPGSSTEAYA
ncbi:hypothetical protein ACFE04_019994 [Oxalis oulophora]